jgi:hypothetical protein|mmetsp:Transcript_38396/g.63805  ORF Transcript_38396/g.63805 Transcript_38396/m.63805 type:complete len:209 (+) Transcript_38396:1769-2395(+)
MHRRHCTARRKEHTCRCPCPSKCQMIDIVCWPCTVRHTAQESNSQSPMRQPEHHSCNFEGSRAVLKSCCRYPPSTPPQHSRDPDRRSCTVCQKEHKGRCTGLSKCQMHGTVGRPSTVRHTAQGLNNQRPTEQCGPHSCSSQVQMGSSLGATRPPVHFPSPGLGCSSQSVQLTLHNPCDPQFYSRHHRRGAGGDSLRTRTQFDQHRNQA